MSEKSQTSRKRSTLSILSTDKKVVSETPKIIIEFDEVTPETKCTPKQVTEECEQDISLCANSLVLSNMDLCSDLTLALDDSNMEPKRIDSNDTVSQDFTEDFELVKEVSFLATIGEDSTRPSLLRIPQDICKSERDSSLILPKPSPKEMRNSQITDNSSFTILPETPHSITAPNRKEIIAEYIQAKKKCRKLSGLNAFYTDRIAEYLRKKRLEAELDITAKSDKSALVAAEERYNKIFDVVKDFHNRYSVALAEFQAHAKKTEGTIEKLKKKSTSQQDIFNNYRRPILLKAVNDKTNIRVKPTDIDDFIKNEQIHESRLRTWYRDVVSWEQKVEKQKKIMEDKNDFGGSGLKVIDYAQLQTENSALNKKIYGRVSEINKLRIKISNAVSIFSHMKENVNFMKAKNKESHLNLQVINGQTEEMREWISRLRQNREMVRRDNCRLAKQGGLLNRESLLLHFENCLLEIRKYRKLFGNVQQEYKKTVSELHDLRKLIGKDKKNKLLSTVNSSQTSKNLTRRLLPPLNVIQVLNN